ncbi:MAG TPA: ATP-dependent helicase, partial [archaeon]|nr:ATP-dependent helicase [archaeon]
RRAFLEDLEPVVVPEKPLDALTHQIAGLLTQKRRWYFNEVLEIFREAYPYKDLTEEELTKVLTYMYTRYPRLVWVSFEDKMFLKPRRTRDFYYYYFGNLSMIPDEKQFIVIDETDDAPIGVLDEAFVAEYGQPGTKFIERGSAWKIRRVSGDHIYVRPIQDPTGAIPSWVGEEIPVPFEIALEVGRIRGLVEERLNEKVKIEEISFELSKQYPVDEKTASRAIAETVEQVEKGYPVPTDKRIILEKWEDYIVINCSFGSLVNRTMARLLGYILSEKTERTIGVQQDPYRVVIQIIGGQWTISPQEIVNLFNELSNSDVKKLAVNAMVKTGLFKKRMVHVARKFGAIYKWADFSKISLRELMKTFEETVIYDEAIKETLATDMDVEHTIEVLNRIRNGEIELVYAKTNEEATPVARVGIERIGRKTDLIPTEKMQRILIDSAKARLLNEVKIFVCTNCWKYVKMIRIKDLPEKIKCPKCGSKKIAVLDESEERVNQLIKKNGHRLSKYENELQEKAGATAALTAKYGKVAAIALAGRRLTTPDAEEILYDEQKLNDHLFEVIIDAEKRALRRRFW